MTDLYYSSTKLLLHCDGDNASTTFTDTSYTTKTVTANGAAQISTAQYATLTGNTASGLFNGTNSYLSVPTSTDFDLGSSYTIEFWMRPASVSGNAGLIHRGLYNTGGATWSGLAFSIRQLSADMRFYFYGTTNSNEQVINVTGACTIDTWKHVAMVRNGTDGQVFIDGISAGTVSGLNTPAASTQALRIGLWDYVTGNEYFNGNIDDIRISNVARYTSNFTPPTDPYPDIGPNPSLFTEFPQQSMDMSSLVLPIHHLYL